MSLNIKNEHVHDLAREAAAALGTTQTGAIEEALRRLLDDVRRDRGDRLEAILSDFDIRIDAATRSRMRVEDLYDDAGLPR